METDYQEVIISQKAVIYDPATSKFLLVKDAKTDGSFYQLYGPWEIIGGRVHAEESFEDALKREVEEEAGNIQYEIGEVIDFDYSLRDYEEAAGADVTYLVTYKGGDVKLSKEHSEFRWETAEEIEKNPEYKRWLKKRIQKALKRIQ